MTLLNSGHEAMTAYLYSTLLRKRNSNTVQFTQQGTVKIIFSTVVASPKYTPKSTRKLSCIISHTEFGVYPKSKIYTALRVLIEIFIKLGLKT